MRAGAAQGAAAGLVYAVWECVFTSLAPAVQQDSNAYTPVHRGFVALLFVVYPLVGAAGGALLGAALRALAGAVGFLRLAAPVVGSLVLVAAFDANLLHLIFLSPYAFESSVKHLLPPVAVSLLPAAACLASFASAAWAARLRFLTNPWTVAFLLTGLPWTTLHLLDRGTTGTKTAAAAAFPAVTLVAAFLLHRALTRSGHRGFPPTRWAAPLCAAALTLVAASVVTHAPLVRGDPPPVAEGDARPNVVVIVMDTVRADHTSLYGYGRETTPELERLARHATVFTRAVSSGDMTLTSHGSLFTGLYGRQHGAHRSDATPAGRPLAAGFVTLAERLLAEGYWTIAVVGNRGYVSPHFGFDQGFLHFDSRGPVPFLAPTPPYYLRRGVRAALRPYASRGAFDQVSRDADAINAEALPLLERARQRGGLFFLFVNYMDAHNPYIPPPPYDAMFPGKDPSFTSADYARLLGAVMERGSRAIPEPVRRHLVSQYDGEIAYEDSRIGLLLRKLRELGLWDDTLIVVTSDHGEALGERSLVNHGVSVYQDQVSVPLIVKFPHDDRARTVSGWASSVDLVPTVLQTLGLPPAEGLAGESLSGNGPGPDRTVVAESFPTGANTAFSRTERALFAGHRKLIRSDEGKRELYDLARDPDETRDLGEAGDADSLDVRLDRWLETTAERADTSSVEMDRDVRERLKALGYVE
jgi:arylsulfatase A-like enzyme